MNNWKKYKLGEVCNFQYGKGLKEENRIKGKFPVYSSAGLIGWHNEPFVNEEGIIVGRKGSVGTIYYSEKPFFPIDTAFYITKNNEKYNLKWLFYLLKTLKLETLNEDSAVP